MYQSPSLMNKSSSEFSKPVKSLHHHQIVKRGLSLDQEPSTLCQKYIIALQASPSLLLTDTKLNPSMIKDGSCSDTSPKSGTLQDAPIDKYELTTPFKKRASLHRKYKLQNSSSDHVKHVVVDAKPRSSSSAATIGSSEPSINPSNDSPSPTQVRPKEFKFDLSSSTVELLPSEQLKVETKPDNISSFEGRSSTISKTVASLKTTPKSRPTDLKLEPIEKRAKINPDYFLPLSIDVGSTTSNSGNNGNGDRTQSEGQTRSYSSCQEVITHRGSCYCGSVRFEFQSRPRVKALVNCTCDSCQKYMDACLYIRSDKFRITAG